MTSRRVSVWYDDEGDMLEVLWGFRKGYFTPTEDGRILKRLDDDGEVIGFLIHEMSTLKQPAPVEFELVSETSDYEDVGYQENGDRMEGLMAEEYRRFDASDYIRTEEDAQGLLRAATDEDIGDGVVIRAALRHVARTQNMSALARDTGLNRGNLYEALSEDGNPTLATLLKVARALGLRLHLEPVEITVEAGRGPKHGDLQTESTST